jgi:hypothetical protein
MKQIILMIIVILFMIVTPSDAFTDMSDTKAISVSLVNQDPDPAPAGDVVEIRLGIENIGGETVNDLMIEIVPEYPFALVTDEPAVQKITTLNSYQKEENMKIIKYRVRVDQDASAGGYELNIKFYEQGSSVIIGKSVTIDVRNKEMAEIIQIDKTNLVPGKQTSLKFKINNVGKAPLKDLVFNWVNEDKIILPVGSDNTKYIRYIEIGDSIELEYQVIADPNAPPGIYELKLYLTYSDPLAGDEKEITTIAGINVGGGTDFDVAFSESSDTQTSFTVANIGSNGAYSVSVIIPQQNGWQVTGSSSVIIGNLNKGDYTVASFNLKQNQQIPAIQNQNIDRQNISTMRVQNSSLQNPQSLRIQIAYTDTLGERKVVEKNVSISQNSAFDVASAIPSGIVSGRQMVGRVPQQQNALTTYKWYIAGFVVLVIAGVSYRKYKQRKLMDPQFTIKDFCDDAKSAIRDLLKKFNRRKSEDNHETE